MTNGHYAMLLIADFIRQMPPDITLDLFCEGVTAAIRREYQRHHLDLAQLQEHAEQRTTASAVIFSRYYREVWMVGDCQCMLNGVLYENNKPAEAVNAKKRSRVIKQALASGAKIEDFQSDDKGRKAILGDIISSMEKQNIDYAVIDGTPIAQDKIRTIMLTTNEPHEIVLATDGYPVLRPTCNESESMLQQQLHDDPLCIGTFQATKGLMAGNCSFDDRAYLRFTTP